jgi:enoyl-CoA hydratase/carnithine racemase
LAEQVGPVVVLTLNRPERHNSLVPRLLEELLRALQGVAARPQLRCVVLQANGRSFSTGGDVRAFYEHGNDLHDYADHVVSLLNRTILALLRLPQPVVGAVHGIVTGGALGLVLGCDVVLVAPEASFTPYYGVVGFAPDGGWTALLPTLIGPRRTAEILMRNGTIAAKQAVAWGLASHVVPADRIRAEALRLASQIASARPGSLAAGKRLLGLAWVDAATRLDQERIEFVRQVVTPEARRGMAAFLGEG